MNIKNNNKMNFLARRNGSRHWLRTGGWLIRRLHLHQLIAILILLGTSSVASAEDTWSVGQAKIKDRVIVYKFTNGFPPKETREKLSWLTVVSWKYDGSTRNGMPPVEVNQEMIRLEDGLETIKGKDTLYQMVYTATGDDLKEFVFYIADRDKFMANFNDALAAHPTYPIEITFYPDETWSDLAKLQKKFGVEHSKPAE